MKKSSGGDVSDSLIQGVGPYHLNSILSLLFERTVLVFKDFKGACHIHTDYSDGNIPIHDVVTSAQDTDLDFIILSDHNTLLPKHDFY